MYKKIILIFVLALSLYASDEKKHDLFNYSYVCVNDSLNFYAGKVYMQNFQDDNAYSVGLLLHEDKNVKTDFGLGYMQPTDQIDSLLISSVDKTGSAKEEGVLFFMNYHF